MIVVADSGPLHYLILLGEVALLHKCYGDVLIPPAVWSELSSPGAPPPVRDWVLAPASWLRVEHVDPQDGTLGVLRVAAENGLIDVPEVLRRLRSTTFYLDEAVIESAFRKWLDK